MNAGDVRRLREAGFIDEKVEAAIVAHFGLEHGRGRLMTVFGFLGAVLVAAGLILLVAANWDEIPRLARVAGGIVLLVAAHGVGWRLGRGGSHPALSATFHFIGSALFLADIALVGQSYHLVSRPPNALLLWWAGIAPLAWILRSRAQHVLGMAALVAWVFSEMNQPDSLLYFGGEVRQLVVVSLFGILFGAAGRLLRRSPCPEFGGTTEKCGLLMASGGIVPLTIGYFHGSPALPSRAAWVFGALSLLAGVLWAFAVVRDDGPGSAAWKRGWAAAQLGLVGFLWAMLLAGSRHYPPAEPGPHWVALGVLFVLGLLQIQVGVDQGSRWWVNAALAFIGIDLVIAYLELIGTMQATGTMFLGAGLVLILVTVLLERQRRRLAARIVARTEGVA